MKTKITIVDPFKGTLVVETEGNAEVYVGNSGTSVKVDGIEVAPADAGPTDPPTLIRTPEPQDQTMTVTEQPDDGPAKELPQQRSEEAAESAQEAPEDEKAEPVQPEAPELKLDGPKPRKTTTKHCATCGDEFEATGNRAQYCPKHKDPANRIKALPEKTELGPEGPQPDGHWWCIHHKSWQEHRSPDCPLNDKQISPAKRAAAATEAYGTGKDFTDPWNCARCREDEHLCKFHRSMEASGSKPPKIRPA